MIDAYLERIGYRGSREPNIGTLRKLQRAHMLTVPFENLDIIAGRPPSLAPDALLEKIVTRRRGGFCYELNGAFFWLLREMGFEVTLLSARPATGPDGYAPPFAHLTLLVELEERWLADVGFGDSFLEPLRLDEPEPQLAGGRPFRVSKDGETWKMEHLFENAWGREHYLFTLEPRAIEDFAAQCRVYATEPDSSFRRGRVCTRATRDGRVTVTDKDLIRVRDGERRVTPLETEDEVAAALRKHFGIELPV